MKIRRKAKRLRKKVVPRKAPNPLRVDPTRTATLRRAFAAKVKAAFKRLRWEIRKLILEEDALGLREVSHDPWELADFDVAVGDDPLPLFSRNAFCPTGEGGGVDPTCSPGGKGGGSSVRVSVEDPGPPDGADPGYHNESSAKIRTAAEVVSRRVPSKFLEEAGVLQDGALKVRVGSLADPALQARGITGTEGGFADDDVVTMMTSRQDQDTVTHTLVHEIAHKWESSHGISAGDDQYMWANLADVSKLSPEAKQRWRYAASPGSAEPLVEAIAQLLDPHHRSFGGKSDAFKQDFPKSFAYAEKMLREKGIPLPPRNPTGNTRWSHAPNPEKVRLFQEWLRQQVLRHVVSQGDADLWRAYVNEGYRRGAGRAYDDAKARMRESGRDDQGSVSDFYRGTKDQFLRSSFAQPVSVEKAKLLAGRAFDDLEGVTADMSLRMSRALTDGLVAGLSPRDVADDLEEEVGLGEARALTVARTELIRAHAEGQLQALDDLGVEEVGVMVEWVVTPDEKLCPKCAALEGVVLKLEEAQGLIPMHPNAVFAGSTFQTYGECLEFVRAHYDGPAVILVADGGHGTTIGPNHPMLTRRGLVRAAELKEGDEVLYDLRRDDPVACAETNLKKVPLVEDAFEACLAVQVDVPVPPSGSDLHGDVAYCQGEIETVRPERGLLSVLDPLGIEKLREDGLPRPYPKADRVPGPGPGSLGRGGVLLPPPGGMGGPDPWVAADDRFVWLTIHSVSFGTFVGAAFDCTTDSSLYCSDGFVVGNCRCTWIPANVGEPAKGQKRSKSEIEDAFTEADMEDEEVDARRPASLFNAFCPTGEGGGVDPTCSPGEGSSPSVEAEVAQVRTMLDKVKGAGVKAWDVKHAVGAYVSDGVAAAVEKLPEPERSAVKAVWGLTKVGTKAAFVSWTAGQALAEKVAVERGMTPQQARTLRGVLAAMDVATFKPIGLAVGATGVGLVPATIVSLVPPATAAYLAYSTAKDPRAVARGAKAAVREAARRLELTMPERPAPTARPGVEELKRNQRGDGRWRPV